ncbi:hypothetical protein F2Q70_00036945 [Brassica cretica]|uniref:Uncharacterized protein n=1 Tax=Brassica cretica TaxID=69181 RepID=A0A8S9JW08_BRACR|nr:hypothetical protein F2Q70_00036945 [Brassica cretica]
MHIKRHQAGFAVSALSLASERTACKRPNSDPPPQPTPRALLHPPCKSRASHQLPPRVYSVSPLLPPKPTSRTLGSAPDAAAADTQNPTRILILASMQVSTRRWIRTRDPSFPEDS